MAETNVRRRRKPPPDGSLEEPLLGFDEDSEAHRAASGRAGSRALIPYPVNAVDWGELVRGLATAAASGIRSIASTISICVAWWRQPRLALTVAQTARLETLRRRIAVPFDGSNPQHQEALRRLWEAAFPGEPCTQLKTERWKDMGWQGADPGTDFRGAGLIGLENHRYMAVRQPALFDRLRHKRDGVRSEWEYPFAVAGINLTFMLIEVTELRRNGLPRTTAGRAFLQLLGEDAAKHRPPVAEGETPPGPFEELYCEAFRVLDARWLAARATYMDFPAVMASTRRDVEKALASSGGVLAGAVQQLRARP